MATIRKRNNHYHVQIRRRGQSITRTFDRLATAKSWIPKIEGDIERQPEALYAFKGRGFGREIGAVCSERLRTWYTTGIRINALIECRRVK